MGLKFVCAVFLLVATGCTAGRNAVLNEKPKTFYYDCCNPSLSAIEKDLCVAGMEDENQMLWDLDGDRHVFIWSNCTMGDEPWRKL